MEDKRMNELTPVSISSQQIQMKNNIENNIIPAPSPGPTTPSSGARRRSGPQILLRSPAAKRQLSSPVSLQGWLHKQGSEGLMLWKKRWFVLTEYCLFYYKGPEEEKLLGSILLPSYHISCCTTEDKISKKFSFKAEHVNMRTYIFSAENQESMNKWINALTLATLVQDSNPSYKLNSSTNNKQLNDNNNYDTEHASSRPSVSSISSTLNQSADDSDSGFHGFLASRDEKQLSSTNNNNSCTNSSNFNTGFYTNSTNTNIKNIHNNNKNNLNDGQGWQQYQQHQMRQHQNIVHHMYGCTRQQQQSNVQSVEPMPRNFGQPFYANAPPKPRRLTDGSTEYSTPSPDPDDTIQKLPTVINMMGINSKSPSDYDSNNIYGSRINKQQQQVVQKSLRTEKSGLNYQNNSNNNNAERRTPDTYGRSTKTSSRINGSDYEDVYAGQQLYQRPVGPVGYCKSPVPLPIGTTTTATTPACDEESIYIQQQQQHHQKKIDQPPRPHSADFLDYDVTKLHNNQKMRDDKLGKRGLNGKQQRPKSSMDIITLSPRGNNIDGYFYSEEKYAEQMRQSSVYFHPSQALNNSSGGNENYQSPQQQQHHYHQEQRNNSSRSTTPSSRPSTSSSKKIDNNYHNENNYDCNNFYKGNQDLSITSPTTQSLKRYTDGNNSYNSGMMRRSLRERNYDSSFYDSSYVDTHGDGTIVGRKLKTGERNGEGYGRQLGEHGRGRRMNDQQFMRSASARLPRHRQANGISGEFKEQDAEEYERGVRSTGGRDGERRIQQREESMKRLLEWKQRMLQSPLTKKPTSQLGGGNNANVQIELSSNYKRQALIDLAAHEASVAEARHSRRRDDSSSSSSHNHHHHQHHHRSHLRSKSTDGCRSVINNNSRYNSYSSDDEEPDDDEIRRKRTRRPQQQSSGKSLNRNSNDDKDNKIPKNQNDNLVFQNDIILPDVGYGGYENISFPVSPVSQFHVNSSININEKKSPPSTNNLCVKKKPGILKNYGIDEEAGLPINSGLNTAARRGEEEEEEEAPVVSAKNVQWDSPPEKIMQTPRLVDESQFIKEYSYQYINAEENDPTKCAPVDSNKIQNDPGVDDKNNPLTVSTAQAIETGPSTKSVKALLADYEKKSGEFNRRLEIDKQEDFDTSKRQIESINSEQVHESSNAFARFSVAESMVTHVGGGCGDDISSDNTEASDNLSLKNDDKLNSEAHYLPMSPKKAILDPTNDGNHSGSKIMMNLFDKLEHEECSYVEMTQSRRGDDGYSILAPNKKNYNSKNNGLDSGDYTTLDSSHYEFVCVADNKIEPVYMEVCQLLDKNKEDDKKTNEKIKKSDCLSQSKLSLDLPDILTTLKSNDANFNRDSSDNDQNNKKNDYEFENKKKGNESTLGDKNFTDTDRDTDQDDFNLNDKLTKDDCTTDDTNDNDNLDDINYLNSSKYDEKINLPRHPRFSLSDTFRPASHYLDRNINLSEFQDSSDSDLVSPPPIPTSPPPLDSLDSLDSHDTIDDLDKKNPTKLKFIKQSILDDNYILSSPDYSTTTATAAAADVGTIGAGNLSGYSQDGQNCLAGGFDQDDEEARYRKMKRRPVGNDVSEILDNLDELESLGSRFDGASIDLDQYLEELRIRDAFNVDLYAKDLSYNSIFGLNDATSISTNKFDGKNYNNGVNSPEFLSRIRGNNNTRTNSASSLPTMRMSDDAPSNHQHSQSFSGCTTTTAADDNAVSSSVYYENVKNFSPLPTMPSDDSTNGLLYNQKIIHEQLEQEEEAAAAAGNLNQQENDQIGAPYYYSDLQTGLLTKLPQQVLIAHTSRLPQLNNQRGNVKLNYTNKRNDIGRLVNPITKQLPAQISSQITDNTDDARKIADELRKKSSEFLAISGNKIYKSDDNDKKNFYESDTLRRIKCHTDSEQLLDDINSVNIYPHGLVRDKSLKNFDTNYYQQQNQPNHRRSRSLEGLLDNIDLNNLIIQQNERVTSVQTVNQRAVSNSVDDNEEENNHVDYRFNRITSNQVTNTDVENPTTVQQENPWEEDNLWRESLRRMSLRHARSLDNLESRGIVDDSRGRSKITRDAVYVNDSMIQRYCAPQIVVAENVDRKIETEADVDGDDEEEEEEEEEERKKKEKLQDELALQACGSSGDKKIEQDGAYECLEMNRSTGGYIWDPKSETYKLRERNNDDDDDGGGNGNSNHFLDNGNLPPIQHMKTRNSFELDREKLRQWDLLSSACSHQEQRALMGDLMSVRGLQILENQEDVGQIIVRTSLPTMMKKEIEKMTSDNVRNKNCENSNNETSVMCEDDDDVEKNNGKASGSGSVIGRDPLPPRAVSTSQLSQNNLTNQPRASSQTHINNGHDPRVQQQMTSPLPVYQSTPQSATITKMRQNINGHDNSVDLSFQNSRITSNGDVHVNNSATLSNESLHMSPGMNLRVISPIDYRISSPSDSERHTHSSSERITMNPMNMRDMNGAVSSNNNYRQAHPASRDSDIIDHQTYKRMMNMGTSRQGYGAGDQKVSLGNGNLVQVSAGELLGRTHEELVLLLIQLRRQSAFLCKAMEKCHMEIEAQARMVELDTPRRLENLHKLDELKNHLIDLEKQYEKGKPLVNLVDNMVKLGSLYNRNGKPNGSIPALNSQDQSSNVTDPRHRIQDERQQIPDERAKKWNHQSPDHGKIQEKVKQLYKIDRLLQEESGTLYHLQQDKELLEKALGGLRNKLQENRVNPTEFERYKKQQSLLERELSRVRMLLAHNSKKLEETVTENARLEQDLVNLRQKIHESRNYPNNLNYKNHEKNTTENLEYELKRVQQLVCDLQRQRQDLSIQVRQLTEKSHSLVKQINPNSSSSSSLSTPTSPLIFSNSHHQPGVHQIYPPKKRIPTSWFETDLDSGMTFDHGLASPSSSTSSSLSPHYKDSNLHIAQLTPQLREQIHQHQLKQQLLKDQMQGKSISSPILTSIPLYINTESRKILQTGLPPEYISPPPPPPPPASLQVMSPAVSPLPPAPPPPPLSHNDESSSFNGTIVNNRDKQQEIKTVRIVKRESERRQRDRDRADGNRNNNIGIPFVNGHAGGIVGHDYEHLAMQRVDENQYYQEDCNYGGGQQGEKSMSLPRGFGGQKSQEDCGNVAPVSPPPRSDSMNALKNIIARCSQSKLDHVGNFDDASFMANQQPVLPMSYQNYASPYTKLRKSQEMNLIQQQQQLNKLYQDRLSNSVASVNSAGGESPQLSPVFKSEAAKQIIKEMTEKKVDGPRKRLVPREKRRHYTVSSCKTIVGLEDLLSKMEMGRARDDLDMERALRPRINAPDVVRSTLSQKELKYNENMIDQLLGAPNKIFIPERYVPEQTPELSAEEKKQRLQKADAIRKMLSETTVTGTDDPNDDTVNAEKSNDFKRKVAEEKKQRDHILQLNQILAKQVMEKSKMVAVTALTNPPLDDEDADDENYDEGNCRDSSPIMQMPLYQQRDNYYY